jgi:4-amino-4-deoxy-L-arabinose transferase-like glycosyltransferase
MNNSLHRGRAALIIILILAATPYFIRLGASSLWDSNEAFYAETPREMIESGDYINPSFNYQPRFNKPPLCYWVAAFLYKLFGVSETVERAGIALAAMVMIAAAYALGSQTFSVEAGLLAAVGLAAAPRFLMFSRRIMIDVYLAMFMSLVLLFFMLAEKYPERRRTFLALMYASAGLGVMTKGPVAIVLPALAFIIYLALRRRLGRIREMMLPIGLVIVSAIVLPWYLAIYHQHGWHYIEAFLFGDNLSRYTQPVWGPRRGAFFYLPVVMGDLFPWSFFLAPALWIAARKWTRFNKRSSAAKNDGSGKNDSSGGESHAAALLVIWVVVIVVFFSLSKSKEDLYVLPIYPAASALAGGLLARFVNGGGRVDGEDQNFYRSPVTWAAVILAAVISFAGVAVIYTFGEGAKVYSLDGASAIGRVALVGALVSAVFVALKKRLAVVAAIALTVIFFNWVFVLYTLPDFERFKPVRPLSEVIERRAGPDALIGYYRFASPSMVFYLRRPIFEYYRPEEIGQAFASGKDVYCLMTAQDYEAVKDGLPVATYILASRPVFQVKLKGVFDEVEPPQVVVISNKGGTDIAQ